MTQLPLLVLSPAKESWFWETAAIGAGVLLLLNLLLMVIVFGRRGYELVRTRRLKAFRGPFDRLIDEIAAGRLSDPEEARRQVASLDASERPLAASMLLERLRAATPLGQSCSAGIAVWNSVESVEELMERVDAALYEAKRQGRDRAVLAYP